MADGYRCTHCGDWHDELPFAYATLQPDVWRPELASDPASELGEEQCIVRGKSFFVRAVVRLPVIDSPDDFEWGVWASLSHASFDKMNDHWETSGRESDPAMFGWLSTTLPTYTPTTLGLKTMVHTQPIGMRPLVELEPTNHPLALEQRNGITVARVRELAEWVLHAAG